MKKKILIFSERLEKFQLIFQERYDLSQLHPLFEKLTQNNQTDPLCFLELKREVKKGLHSGFLPVEVLFKIFVTKGLGKALEV